MTADPTIEESAGREVGEPTAEEHAEPGTTVGSGSRLASVGFGGSLVGYGLRRRGSVRGTAATLLGGYLLYRGVSGRPALSEAVGLEAGTSPRLEPGASPEAVTEQRSITVQAEPEELHQYWREPEHLSQIVGTYADVHGVGDGRVRWTVRGPLGWQRSWQTHLSEEVEGERLHWESAEAAAIPSDATVEFRPAPADRGTEVTVSVRWDPPGGQVGAAVLERLGVVTSSVLGTVLHRFQSLAETGEVPTLEGNPSARAGGDGA